MRHIMKGFTLVELILVILVLGVVSTSITSFIIFGVEIYQDVSGRDKQLSDSRFVIERITREVREALPNSVRVTNNGTCLEFIPILASSSYIDIPVLPDNASNTVTLVSSDETFGQDNTKLVVYPLNTSEVYVDGDSTIGKLFDISSYNFIDVSATTSSAAYQKLELTLNNSVLFDDDSPTERYFIIKDSVAYCQDATNNNILRYQGHNFTATQATPSAFLTDGVLMAERQSNDFPFSTLSSTLLRNSIVVVDFTFTYDDENLRQINEVHVANVP